MRTYQHPMTFETFKASTPEHAAARVMGGKPSDYIVTTHSDSVPGRNHEWLEVSGADGSGFYGDIEIVS